MAYFMMGSTMSLKREKGVAPIVIAASRYLASMLVNRARNQCASEDIRRRKRSNVIYSTENWKTHDYLIFPKL